MHNPPTEDWIVADCFATCSSEPFIVEIADRCRVAEVAAARIGDLKHSAIEIDLSDQMVKRVASEVLENAVLFDANRKQWIYCPERSPAALETAVIAVLPSGLLEWVSEVRTIGIGAKNGHLGT